MFARGAIDSTWSQRTSAPSGAVLETARAQNGNSERLARGGGRAAGQSSNFIGRTSIQSLNRSALAVRVCVCTLLLLAKQHRYITQVSGHLLITPTKRNAFYGKN